MLYLTPPIPLCSGPAARQDRGVRAVLGRRCGHALPRQGQNQPQV